MNSQEQSALKTAKYTQIKSTTVFTLAIARGLSITNVYYNQPLLADIGRSLNISVQEVGFIPTLTQVGYALGLLLLVPLSDKLDRPKLIVVILGVLTFALLAAATSVSLLWLSASSFTLGTYTWGIWQWNGVCALGLCLLSVAAMPTAGCAYAHFSIRKSKPTAI